MGKIIRPTPISCGDNSGVTDTNALKTKIIDAWMKYEQEKSTSEELILAIKSANAVNRTLGNEFVHGTLANVVHEDDREKVRRQEESIKQAFLEAKKEMDRLEAEALENLRKRRRGNQEG